MGIEKLVITQGEQKKIMEGSVNSLVFVQKKRGSVLYGKKENSIIIYVLTGLLFIVLFVMSCSRSVVPKIIAGKGVPYYDKAAEEYLFTEALRQKLTGNPGEAMKNLEQVLRVNPLNDAAYHQMAQIAAGLGDINNGKKYLYKAISISEDNKWYLLMMAGIQYQEGRLDSAIYFYERLTRNYPGNERYLVALGNLYAEDKRFEKAGEIFNKIDNKYGVNEISTIALARSLIEEEKYREARVKIEELILQFPDEILYRGMLAEIYRSEGKPERAVEVYRDLLLKNPDNPQTQLSLCEFLIEQKSYEELMALINTVIMNSKVTREDKITLMAEIIEDEELREGHSNKIEVAIRVLEANYINDDIILLLRPELYETLDRMEDAAERLEEIIAVRPDNYYAWEKLLFIYYNTGRFKELMIRGEQCATRFNRSFIAKMLYATGANENKEFETALNELRKAEILAGDNKEMLAQVYTMRGDVYYRNKDFEQAFRTFERALEINSNDLTVMNNYAYYLTEQNMRLKEAEKMAKQVIEEENSNTAYLDTYAWALYKNGKVRKAEKIMRQIIEISKEADSEYYEHYGYILQKRNRCKDAVIKWQYALEIDSTKSYLKEEIENCTR